MLDFPDLGAPLRMTICPGGVSSSMVALLDSHENDSKASFCGRAVPRPGGFAPALGEAAADRLVLGFNQFTEPLGGRRCHSERRRPMAESVYKVIELVGTSSESWEKAAAAAVQRASASLRDLRIAEVVELDMQLEDGQVRAYRAKVKVSFKYEGGD